MHHGRDSAAGGDLEQIGKGSENLMNHFAAHVRTMNGTTEIQTVPVHGQGASVLFSCAESSSASQMTGRKVWKLREI